MNPNKKIPIKPPKYIIEGGGKWAGIHARNFEQILGVRPAAVSTSNKDRKADWESKEVQVFPRGELTEAAQTADFAVVAVLPDHIEEATMQLMKTRGNLKAILVEKPLATSMKQLVRLMALAEKKEIQLVMAGQTRFSETWQKFANLVARSEEKTKSITIRRKFPYQNPANGEMGTEKYGSVIWNLLPHSIGELEHLLLLQDIFLNDVEIKDARGSMENPAHADLNLFDSLELELQTPSGMPITIEVSQACKEGETANETVAYGEGSEIISFEETNRGKIIKNNGHTEVRSGENTVKNQAEAFLKANGITLNEPKSPSSTMNIAREHDRIIAITDFLQKVQTAAKKEVN